MPQTCNTAAEMIERAREHTLRLTLLRLAIGVTRAGEGQEERAVATARAMYRFVTGDTVTLQ
jgi:hypothetical protein